MAMMKNWSRIRVSKEDRVQTKEERRLEHEENEILLKEFLDNGGEIEVIPCGATGIKRKSYNHIHRNYKNNDKTE